MQLAAAGASVYEDPFTLAANGDGDGLHAGSALLEHGPVTRAVVDMARPETGRTVVAVLCPGRVGWDVETAVDAAERARLCARPMSHAA